MLNFIDIKEKLLKIKFALERIVYSREKHYFIAIFMLVIIISLTAVGIYFYQKKQIKVKENILKSYYSDIEKNNEKDLNNLGKTSSGSDSEDKHYDSSSPVNSKSDSASYLNFKSNSVLDNGLNSSGKNMENENNMENYYTDNLENDQIKAYICGSVLNPGVYELSKEARIADLLKIAGGADKEACLEVVNLALKLNDQDMVYIPSKQEIEDMDISVLEIVKNNSLCSTLIKSVNTSSINSSKSDNADANNDANNITSQQKNSDEFNQLININLATLEELELLPGIGEKIAINIIEYRKNYGNFKNIEQIKNVKGIGDKKFNSIKDLIKV